MAVLFANVLPLIPELLLPVPGLSIERPPPVVAVFPSAAFVSEPKTEPLTPIAPIVGLSVPESGAKWTAPPLPVAWLLKNEELRSPSVESPLMSSAPPLPVTVPSRNTRFCSSSRCTLTPVSIRSVVPFRSLPSNPSMPLLGSPWNCQVV